MNKKILLIAESIDNRLNPSTEELVSFALAAGFSESETVILIPGQNIAEASKKYTEAGIDVILLQHNALTFHNPEALARNAANLARETGASCMAMVHTMHGCAAAAQIANQLSLQLVTAVESFSSADGSLRLKRSIYNGKIIQHIDIPENRGMIVTLQPGAFASQGISEVQPGPGHGPAVREPEIPDSRYTPLGISGTAQSTASLKEADIIVSAGRGLAREEDLEIIRDTAALFPNSAVGASRILCDRGWLPYAHQVGMTGNTVSPRLYMACGISGAQQHLVGMKGSQCIIAVNNDPDAPIFSIADYGVVEDLQTFLPVFARVCREKFGTG